jgi:hypothetical protein
MKKWNFRKYCKRDDWIALQQVEERRKDEGKESEVLFDGKLMNPDRVRKEIGRHRKHRNGRPSPQGTSARSVLLRSSHSE